MWTLFCLVYLLANLIDLYQSQIRHNILHTILVTLCTMVADESKKEFIVARMETSIGSN
jgi:hypothetical protein